jgi:hypothetical protein
MRALPETRVKFEAFAQPDFRAAVHLSKHPASLCVAVRIEESQLLMSCEPQVHFPHLQAPRNTCVGWASYSVLSINYCTYNHAHAKRSSAFGAPRAPQKFSAGTGPGPVIASLAQRQRVEPHR